MDNYGILSIMPPAISIFLAIYTRNVIFSLAVGTFSGALILAQFNPFFAIVNLLEKHVFVQISISSNTQVLVTILIIGGFVSLLDRSDGTKVFSRVIIKLVSTRRRGQLAAWLAGIGVFFSDSGNALIVGPLFRPIFDKLNICKEKLAYIIDTTAAPVCILVPFISWGVYIMSLIESSYQSIGLTESPYQVLLSVWPYQFYAILALLSIPMILITGKDIGPMAKAQIKHNKSIANNKPEETNATPEDHPEKDNSTLMTFIAPLLTMIISMAIFLIYFAYTEGVTGTHVRSGICLAYIFASIACAYMMYRQKKISYNVSLKQFVSGMEKMVFICFILVLAWTLGSVCKDLNTSDYLASLLSGRVSPALFPVIVFGLGAIMSFATGSSYGTFAFLMIIAVPVADTLGASLTLTVAAVLSGGLFGDHTSPISDTTVLASMGAGCNHIDHVSTQLVYAAFVGFMAMIGFIVAGLYPSSSVIFLMIGLQFVAIYFIMKFFGKDSFSNVPSSAYIEK